MTREEFQNLKLRQEVIIKGRVAHFLGPVHFGPERGGRISYLWAMFQYCDTKRKVTKRHRQVERIKRNTLPLTMKGD